MSFTRSILSLLIISGCFVACQDEAFDYQPGYDHATVHLSFNVRTPSKADILFVVDDSNSMGEEQVSLQESITAMIRVFANKDTEYRIGVTSNDMLPDDSNSDRFVRYIPCTLNSDCAALSGDWYCKSDCPTQTGISRCVQRVNIFSGETEFGFGDAGTDVFLCRDMSRNGHNGIEGRLVSVNNMGHVIDRKALREEYASEDEVSKQVALRLAQNILVLSTQAQGYEQGLKAASLAVGIDPDDSSNPANPANNLTNPGEPNYYTPKGAATSDDDPDNDPGPWVRENAMLAVIFITDEDDCSYENIQASVFLNDLSGSDTSRVTGQNCYAFKNYLRPVDDFVDAFVAKKGYSQLAFGLIGGITPASDFTDDQNPTMGAASDCRREDSGPSSDCTCIEHRGSSFLCAYTELHPIDFGGDTDFDCSGDQCCQAMSASRYYDFTTSISRHRIDSICQDDYSVALEKTADIATRPCFDLIDEPEIVAPACQDATQADNYIIVERNGIRLPMVQEGASEQGWYYVTRPDNLICLNGLDRLTGDKYDIYITHTNDNGHESGCIYNQ